VNVRRDSYRVHDIRRSPLGPNPALEPVLLLLRHIWRSIDINLVQV
jgi:hypothetical protein